MSAVLSPGPDAAMPRDLARPLPDAAMQALCWSLIVALAVASALLIRGVELFDAPVGLPLAAAAAHQQVIVIAAPAQSAPFYQQKLDARFEELPAQF